MTYNFIKNTCVMLSQEEEIKLFNDWLSAKDAGKSFTADKLFEQIIIQYSPIVNKIVTKMQGYRLDPNELTSEALVALSKAAIDFDINSGFRFATYATKCITGSLYTYITKNYFMTNVCTNSKNKKVFFRLRNIMAEKYRTGSSVEMNQEWAEELATQLDVDADTVQMMHIVINAPYSSLNTKISEEDGDSTTHQDMLMSDDLTQDDSLEIRQLNVLHKQLIDEALETLDGRTATIIRKQTLCDKGDKATLEDLGEEFDISRERVRQLRVKGLEDISKHIQTELELRAFDPSEIFIP